MLEIEIDGKKITTPAGGTIMDAAAQAGVYIPHFCYHKKLSIAANCRMCLVQVEKAAKPLPACATPITDGMKVMTRSDYAIKAQKGVMEFLLINHPLDCPICDQGGECQLQDLAVGYGGVQSRYQEAKRVVNEKDLGPLVATDMTRCIHCTRCVRFGQEIAGIMEMGQIGRGEHSEIMPFIDKTIDSELSGNIIDLCPVGALTSKPFRYSARSWELSRRRSVSPHDSLGSNLAIQVKDQRVMRVLPLDNEDINECWLSDRDRFSYEGLNAPERLTTPMIKQGGQWLEVGWQAALEYVANGLKDIVSSQGGDALAALASPQQTVEEMYLLQKLVRGLGSENIDARPRQADFRLDTCQQGATWMGLPVARLNTLDRIMLVGTRLRQDHPLIAHRLRLAVRHGADCSLINPCDDDLLMPVANKLVVPPQAMVRSLAGVAVALSSITGKALPAGMADSLAGVQPAPEAEAMAASLASGTSQAILLGNLALQHEQYTDLRLLAQAIADMCGAAFGVLGNAANGTGAAIAGALPRAGGRNAASMFGEPRKAYLMMGIEPGLDCNNPRQVMDALVAASLSVCMTSFKPADLSGFDVLLPVAPFSETAGTFISGEGRVQSFNGAVRPLGETRPGWKVLRVLGSMLGLSGFGYDTVEGVRKDILPADGLLASALNNRLQGCELASLALPEGLWRVGDVPAWQADAIVRHAPSLQKTRTAEPAQARVHPQTLSASGLADGSRVKLRQGTASAELTVRADASLAPGCIRVPAAVAETAGLGASMGVIAMERA